MMKRLHDFAQDERGQTFALMAVMVAAVVAMLSLAVDLGMLYTARSEAQRAASAAALAGAQEFLHIQPASAAATPARDSAMVWALKNTVRNIPIDSAEVQIAVDVSLMKVSVRIDRANIPLWFARLLGKSTGAVNAHAAAHAAPAGAATCIAPFAVPDMWGETPGTNGGDDTNNDDLWDLGETWAFGDDAADTYSAFGSGVAPETGYGSAYRNAAPGGIIADYGRPMILKVQDPSSAPVSGFFYPFQIGTNSGASDYRNSITNCDPQVVSLNTPIPLEMGNMVGPTRQGVTDLVALDSTAYWDTSTNNLVSSYGFSSPRVKIIPLYDPNYINSVQGGNHTLTFNNFAMMFMEGMVKQGNNEFVVGRFLFFAQGVGGAGPGGATGSLVRILQLVE